MARTVAVPAPVGGWNAKDALADMAQDQAVILDNWFPGEGRVSVRPGYTSYATGLEGNVETVAEFINGPNRKFLGFANNKIWNISATGAAADLTNSMTITSNRWDWVCMDGKMALVNGVDAPLQIASDGTTASALTISGSGLTVANLIGVNVFKGRSYFWLKESQDFWYSAVNTLGGALTKFELSRVGQFGGKLLAMGTWTIDGGAGGDDYSAFFMTSGETIIYQGSDPSSYNLVGVFSLGAPVSQRGIVKLAGDLTVITKDGYISLNGALNNARLGDRGILSDQINPAVTDTVKENEGNFGWQAFHYPRGNMIIFNIPLSTNTTYSQHVFNSNTGKPCRFKGINSRCWGLYNDKAYFGGNGVVYLFDDGYDDVGKNIDCDAQPAWNYMGTHGAQKHVTALQAVMSADGAVEVSTALASDFKTPTVAYITPSFTGGVSSWDDAVWDAADWSSGGSVSKDWKNRNAFGYAIGARVRVRTKGQLVKWFALNYMVERGGLT